MPRGLGMPSAAPAPPKSRHPPLVARVNLSLSPAGAVPSQYVRLYPHYNPPGRGRWHAPSSRHYRALLSVCGRCSFGGLGCCSCRVCVSVSGVLFSVGVCVCDLLICLPVGVSARARRALHSSTAPEQPPAAAGDHTALAPGGGLGGGVAVPGVPPGVVARK